MPDTTAPAPDPSKEGYFLDLPSPRDSTVERDRASRALDFAISTIVLWGGPIVLLLWWSMLVSPSLAPFAILIGFVIGAFLEYLGTQKLIIYNEEWTAYATNDPFSGDNVAYGPGAHLSHFWEQRNKSGIYSLERITRVFTVDVATTTSKVTATVTYQYAVYLPWLLNFIGNDISTIESGFIGFLQSFLTEKLAGDTAESARKKIRELNTLLAQEFMQVKNLAGTSAREFEEKNGILSVSILITGLALPEAVQKTRDAVEEARVLMEVAARMMGKDPEKFMQQVLDGTIPWSQYEKILNRAMAVSENAQLELFAVEGDIGNLGAAALARFAKHGLGGGEEGGKKKGKGK
ncbi:MAG TPA: hypothetical protein VHD31_03270 [Candidatus Paceibacterota bacterium]|nr:hypothetical protein [Candidatus Paceibacterota bacterium]